MEAVLDEWEHVRKVLKMSFGQHFAMILNASGSPMVGSCTTFWKISKATNGASDPTADMAQVCDVTWAYVFIHGE